MIPRHGYLRGLQFVCKHLKIKRAQYWSEAGNEPEVLFESHTDKRIIILNRPDVLNALNLSMIREIYPRLVKWESDPLVTLVIIKSAVRGAFSSGPDVKAIYEAAKSGDEKMELQNREFFQEEYMLNHKIGTYKKPYVCLMDGITMGLGLGVGVSTHRTFQVATERSMFCMPETSIGWYPHVGAGYFMPRLRGRLGNYLTLTGFQLKGRDIQQAGLATHFVEAKKMKKLEQAILETHQPGEQQVLEVLETFHEENPIDKDRTFILAPYVAFIDQVFGEETVEDIISQLQADDSDWALEQLMAISKMSPTSMKVAQKLLKMGEAQTLSLAETLQIEHRLSHRFLESKDFFEGVRAVLLKKDNKPKWDPSTLEAVTQEKLDWFFAPLSEDRELNLFL